jgi:cell division protein FtsN
MTQTSGEKELILGNKQLISLFFVVVALCGVFFAMGYMVRGNGLKGSVAGPDEAASTAGTDTLKRQQPEPPRETVDAAQPPQTGDTQPVETHPADDAGAVPSGTTQANGTAVVGTPADARPPVQAPAVQGEVKPLLKPEEAGATYLQVAALPRPNAEATVRMLREQHLPGAIEASSREGLFRVMVGPYHETADVADAKARLKALGFSDVRVQKQ